jgi:hypothetical protein
MAIRQSSFFMSCSSWGFEEIRRWLKNSAPG